MVDRHEEVSAHVPREADDARGGRSDEGADGRGDIDAAMPGAVRSVGRIEPTDDRTDDRPRP